MLMLAPMLTLMLTLVVVVDGVYCCRRVGGRDKVGIGVFSGSDVWALACWVQGSRREKNERAGYVDLRKCEMAMGPGET